MGWSKWSSPFFFLQLLILLPLSLELELHQFEEDSSCHCPKYQPSYPNLAVDQCLHFIQTSVVQDREKLLAELRGRIKKELIADFGAAIQSTLQHFSKMIDYSPLENANDGGFQIGNYQKGPTPPANDNNDDRHETHNYGKVLTAAKFGFHHDPD